MIKRVQVARGVAWTSRRHKVWFGLGGEIYIFSLQLGQLHIDIERKNK